MQEIINSKNFLIYDRVWIDGCPETQIVDIDMNELLESMKEYAEYYAKKCLKIAAEEAEIVLTGLGEEDYEIDKESITNIQLPEHD